MKIKIVDADCSRYQDKTYLIIPATLLLVGVLFLGLVVGCSVESGMNTKTIVFNCIVAFLFWFVTTALFSLAACPVFECLAHTDGFVEAVKKKTEKAAAE